MGKTILQLTVLSLLTFGAIAYERFDWEYENRELSVLRNQGEEPAWAKSERMLDKANSKKKEVAAR